MKLMTCSHMPSTSCFVTEICLPHFSIFELPYPASYINTLITINDLHSSVYFNWRNFFCGQEFNNSTMFEPNVWKLPFWYAMGEACKHVCVQGEVWWKTATVWLHRTGFIQMSNVNKNITVEAKLNSPPYKRNTAWWTILPVLQF